MFGFGGRKARVRATVREPLAPPSVDGAGNVSRETSSVLGQSVSRETSPRARPSVAASAGASDAFTERARAVLAEILSRIGVSCSVEVRPGSEPGVLELEVSGDSSGLLIGRRGQTLDALEYMVNRIAGRAEDSAIPRIGIDVEHYRYRRKQYLETLARRLAEKAKQSGRVVTLNPMSPRDRRIVHLVLQDDGGVATRSEGEGHFRKLTILPADRRRDARPGRSSG
jgi:spoIIIJ-associated protein